MTNVATTMGFYVSMTADDVAADLWAHHTAPPGNTVPAGNTSGNAEPAGQ